MASFAQSQINKINLVDAVPWVLGAIGVVLVALGLVLGRRAGGTVSAEHRVTVHETSRDR
jgi:hypothetical protein